MLKRLQTDKSLSAFAAQFVPLKLTTDGNRDWSKWARKYRFEGQGIPILFVIRADGQKLYAKSGSLRGDSLPSMLLATLRQSGRTLTPPEVKLLELHVPAAQRAIDKKDPLSAARALTKLKKLGPLGQLGSYATTAVTADNLVKQTLKLGRQAIETAAGNLTDKQQSLVSLLQLIEGDSAFTAFPPLRSANQKALSAAKRDSQFKVVLEQAKALEKARRYAASNLASVRKRAADAFQVVITKYPGTEAGKMAEQGLAKIRASASTVSRGEKPLSRQRSSFRLWTDSTGEFKIKARLISVAGGKITLQKLNGQKIVLPLERLSTTDRTHLRSLKRP